MCLLIGTVSHVNDVVHGPLVKFVNHISGNLGFRMGRIWSYCENALKLTQEKCFTSVYCDNRSHAQ